MVPVRPEFFYHPAVGVVSPTSLGLFAFKPGPLTITTPPPLASSSPKSPIRTPQPAAAAPSILNQASPIALNTEAAPSSPKDQEFDMKNAKSETNSREVCIVTGEEFPIGEMIRFVVNPDNEIVADLSEKLPGEGFWIKAHKDILKKAVWRNSFTTAARKPVTVAKNLLEQIQLGLLKQSLETMSLARKAGLLIQGFAKVEEVLKERRASLYIVASDAKENGREKLEKLAGKIPVLTNWTSSQLSAALGSDNAVHVVLTPGGLSDKLLTLAQKLKDFQ